MIFHSHKNPDKLLRIHLVETADIACRQALFHKDIYIASMLHDFGKYTTFFQTYLDTGEETVLSRHGFISAAAAAFISLKLSGDKTSSIAVYSAVLHHHGNLKSTGHNLPQRRGQVNPVYDAYLISKINNAKSQIEDMACNIDSICSEYEDADLSILIKEFIDKADIEDLLIQLKTIELKTKPEYFRHQYIYSRLLYADKMSASNTVIPKERHVCYSVMIAEKKKVCNTDNRLNEIRNRIFETVTNNLNDNWKDSHIFSITAPTGTGKTYAGFFAALRLKELAGLKGRIVYALPFTSIIDQNYSSLKKLYANAGQYDNSAILMHHHLGETAYSVETTSTGSEKEDYSLMQAQLLIESWNSGVVVTTFVQLLETILGVRNKMLKKFHTIEDSIILIDEIQSIDIKYHRLIEELLIQAVQIFNCRIILMTATKPVIFQSALELLTNHAEYYKVFNRTRLCVNLEPVSCDEFAAQFMNQYCENKSYLIVCNTIRQSLDVFKLLENQLDSDMLFYLSTNIVPRDRKKVISKVDKLQKKGKKPVLISTQVVEAGVDLDFDEVYRDIAPLDSIIQCAGRCNRNDRQQTVEGTGNVNIVQMMPQDSKKNFARMVYSLNWLGLTLELLQGRKVIGESEYLDLINRYFDLIKGNTSDVEYIKYKKAVCDLDFDTIAEFSLIANKGGYIDVFVMVDEEAEDVFCSLSEILGLKDKTKRQEKLLKIRNSVLKYIISVPLKYKSRVSSNDRMFYLPTEICCEGGQYTKKTGFNRVDHYDQFF